MLRRLIHRSKNCSRSFGRGQFCVLGVTDRLVVVSEVVSHVGHPDRPFDLEDLLDAPEDGYRYEVIDGALVVDPAPSWRHQSIIFKLLRVLDEAAPKHLVVIPAPAWRIGPGQVPEPDGVVVDRSKLGEIAVEGTPELVVEVLSPSNRGSDLVRKRELYAQAGCPSYGIVDSAGPAVTVLVLDERTGTYRTSVEGARGDTLLKLDRPFPVSFRPADL